MKPLSITPNINKWLKEGDRGTSSLSILQRLTGINFVDNVFGMNHPYDPADLYRCVKLIETAPELREHLHKMKDVTKTWELLVDEWDELVTLMKKEIKQNGGKCPKTFDRMQELRKEGDRKEKSSKS